MPPLVIVAAAALSGKTTIAAAIGKRLAGDGRSVALLRLTGDDHAGDDARLFAALDFNTAREPGPLEPAAATADADVTIIEAPSGGPGGLAASLSAKVVIVAAYADPLPADIASCRDELGDSCAGAVVNRVPGRRLDATRAAVEATGVRPLALIPEDRTLAAPSLGAIARALEAETSFLNSSRENVIDHPVVSSISVDPAQGYFARSNPNAVIVRGDKPDQQLGALNAGAPCLIVTGGLPLLSYVESRAEEEEIPLLTTRCDTLTTVERVEALYGVTPFAGRTKLERIADLTGDLDLSWLA